MAEMLKLDLKIFEGLGRGKEWDDEGTRKEIEREPKKKKAVSYTLAQMNERRCTKNPKFVVLKSGNAFEAWRLEMVLIC